MKITNPMKWGFDPRLKGLHPIFKTEKGRIIWGAIKCRHITDQYFDDNCYKFLKIINKNKPKDAKELFSLTAGCGLNVFGKVPSEYSSVYNSAYGGNWSTKPDMEFWGEMFDALNGKLKIVMEYPDKE